MKTIVFIACSLLAFDAVLADSQDDIKFEISKTETKNSTEKLPDTIMIVSESLKFSMEYKIKVFI